MRLQRMHSLSQSQAELEAILHSGGHPGADEGLKVPQPGTHPATAPYQAGAAQPASGGLATGQPAGSAGGPPVQHEPTSPEPWALHQLPNSTQRRTNASEVLRQATQIVIGPDEDEVHPEGARDGLTAVRSLREQLDQAASHEHQGGKLSCRKLHAPAQNNGAPEGPGRDHTGVRFLRKQLYHAASPRYDCNDYVQGYKQILQLRSKLHASRGPKGSLTAALSQPHSCALALGAPGCASPVGPGHHHRQHPSQPHGRAEATMDGAAVAH